MGCTRCPRMGAAGENDEFKKQGKKTIRIRRTKRERQGMMPDLELSLKECSGEQTNLGMKETKF